MKYRTLIVLLLLLGCERHEHKDAQITGIPGKKSVLAQTHRYIVLIGGANMTGQGMLNNPFPNSPGVAIYGSPNTGPGYAFGRDYAYDEGALVEIFQCAVGGSTLTDWAPGSALHAACQAQWIQHGRPGISAILFLGGEKEALDHDMASAQNWAERFMQYSQIWRNSFANANIPVIVCQIGPNPALPGPNPVFDTWKMIQDQQGDLFGPNVGIVTSHDLSLADGWVLFDKQSYASIGERMYNKYCQLAGSNL